MTLTIVEHLCPACGCEHRVDAAQEDVATPLAALVEAIRQVREKLTLAETQRDAARAIVARDLPELNRCKDVAGFAAIMGVEYDEYQRVKMEKRDVEAERDRLAAELAEAQVELNAASDATGLAGVDEPLSLLDAVSTLRRERDAAQAALVGARTEARQWAAGIADATADEYDADSEADDEFAGVACRASRDGAREVAVRIRRGPAPEETK